MLIIRQEQIDTILMGDKDEFVELIVREAKTENPDLEKKYDNKVLEKMARGGIQRAKNFGFTTSRDISSFVSLMFKFTPNFNEQAEIKEILDDENYSTAERFTRLNSPDVSEETWKKVINNYDEKAWSSKSPKRKSGIPKN